MRRTLLLMLVLGGCAHAPPPAESHVPSPGRYRYVGEYAAPGEPRGDRFEGVLVITKAAPERITGYWEVPGYQRDLQIGAHLGDGYVANADVVRGSVTHGTFQHRVRRVAGPTELACAGEFVTADGHDVVAYPARCTLTFLGS